jgi:hypothetical protein
MHLRLGKDGRPSHMELFHQFGVWFSSILEGESAQHTINVLTAPLITFIMTDETTIPIVNPIL